MENKVVINKKAKPDFLVEFYGVEMKFKNLFSLNGLLIERLSRDRSSGQIVKTLRAAAYDLEQFEEVVGSADMGDITELFRVWNEHAKELIVVSDD